MTLTGCPANTEIILFHIHKQVAGQNGSVVIDSGQKNTEPIVLATGATTGTVTPMAAAEIGKRGWKIVQLKPQR